MGVNDQIYHNTRYSKRYQYHSKPELVLTCTHSAVRQGVSRVISQRAEVLDALGQGNDQHRADGHQQHVQPPRMPAAKVASRRMTSS